MKKRIINYILALCSVLTIFLSFKSLNLKNPFLIVTSNIETITYSILFVIVFINSYKNKKSKYNIIISILFTLFSIIGSLYINYGTIEGILFSKKIFIVLLKTVGMYYGCTATISYLEKNIPNFINKESKKVSKLGELFNEKTFLFCLIALIASWSIYYIVYYPIVLSPDPSFQIKQALGERTKYSDYSVNINENITITNHHPVLHTVLLGSCVKLGRALINDNFGLFIYTFIQGLSLALCLSYSIVFFKKRKVKNKFLYLMLGIYALVPQFGLYAVNGNKDVFYTIFVIWLLMFIFDLIENKNDKLSFRKCIEWFFVLLFICLFRNNGLLIVVLLLPFIIFVSKINFKKILSIFLSVTIIYLCFIFIGLPYLGITKGSTREGLSIFFQQTARYVINYEDELSKDDKKIIGNILDYDNIKENYNPILADPVKSTFNKYATSNDLKLYFNVWFKGLLNHPITYIDATLNNIYGYFSLEAHNWYIYTKYDTRITQNNLVDYHYNNLNGLRNVLSGYGNAFPYLPFIGLFSNIGFNTFILISYGIYLLLNKKGVYVIYLIPLYVSLLACVLSPANTYFRYAMPYVFSLPIMIISWIYLAQKKN